ncbi:hypothetical protein CMV_009633 [Castanea mollissima]|uniref:Uncharacterized protein n=1 Tax=Castanea mollissima TaxID=60419 RepID=A0A8J4RKD5_9ROSI|nr:hypothetical protein CMV_009633 [Castanea mollissima]
MHVSKKIFRNFVLYLVSSTYFIFECDDIEFDIFGFHFECDTLCVSLFQFSEPEFFLSILFNVSLYLSTFSRGTSWLGSLGGS